MWQRLFKKEWRTNTEVKVGDMKAGTTYQSKIRAFYGEYKISLSTGGKIIHEETTTITKTQGWQAVNLQLSQPVIG